MRKLALSFVLFGLAALALLPASGLAAKPTKFHDNFDFTVPNDNICGIDVTTHGVGVDNFFVLADLANSFITFRDTSSTKFTFTAANGKSVVVSEAGQHDGTAITNPDGSITFVDTYKGLPEKIFTPNGPVLTRDAGFITFYNTFDANGNFLSFSFVEKGPHPENDSDFQLFCQVVTAALT